MNRRSMATPTTRTVPMTTDEPLAAFEACLRLAGASGVAVTYDGLADIVRDVRQSVAANACEPETEPPLRRDGVVAMACPSCTTTGTAADGSECSVCEGTGIIYQ